MLGVFFAHVVGGGGGGAGGKPNLLDELFLAGKGLEGHFNEFEFGVFSGTGRHSMRPNIYCF